MKHTCNLYKITLLISMDTDPAWEVFWGYHMSEAQARDAALRWAEGQWPREASTISRVDLIQ